MDSNSHYTERKIRELQHQIRESEQRADSAAAIAAAEHRLASTIPASMNPSAALSAAIHAQATSPLRHAAALARYSTATSSLHTSNSLAAAAASLPIHWDLLLAGARADHAKREQELQSQLAAAAAQERQMKQLLSDYLAKAKLIELSMKDEQDAWRRERDAHQVREESVARELTHLRLELDDARSRLSATEREKDHVDLLASSLRANEVDRDREMHAWIQKAETLQRRLDEAHHAADVAAREHQSVLTALKNFEQDNLTQNSTLNAQKNDLFQSEIQIARLQGEVDNLRAELKSSIALGDAQVNENRALQVDHSNALAAQKEKHTALVEELLRNHERHIDQLERAHNQELEQSKIQTHTVSMTFQEETNSLHIKQENLMTELIQKHQATLAETQRDLERLRIQEVEDLKRQSAEREADQLKYFQAELENVQGKSTKAIDDLQQQHARKFDELKREYEGRLEGTQREWESKYSEYKHQSEQRYEDLRRESENRYGDARREAEELLKRTIAQYEEDVKELKSAAEENLSKSKTQHESIVYDLKSTQEEFVSKLRTQHEEQVERLRITQENELREEKIKHEEAFREYKIQSEDLLKNTRTNLETLAKEQKSKSEDALATLTAKFDEFQRTTRQKEADAARQAQKELEQQERVFKQQLEELQRQARQNDVEYSRRLNSLTEESERTARTKENEFERQLAVLTTEYQSKIKSLESSNEKSQSNLDQEWKSKYTQLEQIMEKSLQQTEQEWIGKYRALETQSEKAIQNTDANWSQKYKQFEQQVEKAVKLTEANHHRYIDDLTHSQELQEQDYERTINTLNDELHKLSDSKDKQSKQYEKQILSLDVAYQQQSQEMKQEFNRLLTGRDEELEKLKIKYETTLTTAGAKQDESETIIAQLRNKIQTLEQEFVQAENQSNAAYAKLELEVSKERELILFEKKIVDQARAETANLAQEQAANKKEAESIRSEVQQKESELYAREQQLLNGLNQLSNDSKDLYSDQQHFQIEVHSLSNKQAALKELQQKLKERESAIESKESSLEKALYDLQRSQANLEHASELFEREKESSLAQIKKQEERLVQEREKQEREFQRVRQELVETQNDLYAKLEEEQSLSRKRIEEQQYSMERRLSDEAHLLERERSDFERESKLLKKKLDSELREFEQQRAKYGDLQSEIQSLNREIDLKSLNFREELDSAERRLKEVRQEIEAKETVLANLQETTRHITQAQSELADLKNEIQRQERAYHEAGLVASQKAHEKELALNQSYQNKMLSLEKQFKEQSQAYETRLNQLEKQHRESIASVEKQLQEKQSQFERTQQDSSASQAELSSLVHSVDGARETLREYQHQITKYESTLRDLKLLVEENERRNETNLGDMVREMERKKEELARLERLVSQRTNDLNDLEDDYQSKQSHLDMLQGEVVKLENIVETISAGVRERKHISDLSPSAATQSIAPTPLYGSPANRLAASAASAAAVARQMAEEEDRQFSQSLHLVNQSPKSAALRSPYRSERASSVQRSLQSQLNDLEQEVQSMADERRRNGH